jgi:hypothetical protein
MALSSPHTLEIDYTPSTKKTKEAPLESLRVAVDAVVAARMQEKPLRSVWYNGYGNLVEPDESKRVDKQAEQIHGSGCSLFPLRAHPSHGVAIAILVPGCRFRL